MFLYIGKKERIILYAVTAFILLLTGFAPTHSYAQEQTTYHAVIIRAAGHLPGEEKPEGEDAITHATSEPGNTYVFCEKLVKELSARNIETRVIEYSECPNLSCLDNRDATGARHGFDIVILAGPSYGRKMPAQLQAMVPGLKEIAETHPDIICTSLISANFTYRGIVTMKDFTDQLEQTGVRTVTGVVFNSDVIQTELDEDMKDFADSLLEEVKR